MKRIAILTALAVTAAAGAASAMNNSDAILQSELRGYAVHVDVTQLTESEKTALNQILHGGGSTLEVRSKIVSAVK